MEKTENNNSDKLQQLAMQDAPGKCNAVRALLLGLCQTVRLGLKKADSYNELLEDDIEFNGGNVEYLHSMHSELENLSRLMSEVLSSPLSKQSGERLNLSRLTAGVIERYVNDCGTKREVSQNLDDELFILGDAFALQELLLDILLHFEAGADAAPLPRWRVTGRRVTFTAAEQQMLELSQETSTDSDTPSTPAADRDYIELVVMPDEAAIPDAGKLRLYRELLAGKEGAQQLLDNAKWLGTMLAHDGNLFYVDGYEKQSAVLLFPMIREWDQQSSELDRYRWDNASQAKTILLVDDEDMIWDVLLDMLQSLGYQVILAGDGKEAVEIYGSNPGKIDLVILDMLMPNMGGSEAFFFLRKIDPSVKVLATSGYVSEEDIQDVMKSGAVGFLRKPYRLSELAKKIREIFSKG